MKKIPKKEILEYLEEAGHTHFPNSYPIAWNIKMYNWEFQAGKGESDYPVLDRYDEEWDEYLAKNTMMFWWVCEDCLRYITEDGGVTEGHPDPTIASISYKMHTFGRSGGWLVLKEYDGYKLWQESWEMFEDWDYESLWILYKFCMEVQSMVDLRHESMNYEYAFRRWQMEQEWIERDKELEAAEEENSGISYPVVYPIPKMPLCYFPAISKPFDMTRSEFGRLTYTGEQDGSS